MLLRHIRQKWDVELKSKASKSIRDLLTDHEEGDQGICMSDT